MAKLAKAIEGGAVGANQAVDLIIEGMKEFDGMMDKTANETVGGLKSQLEDVFEINIARKWGQGLQDGAKRGLGSIVKLLDKSEDGLKNVGDQIYNMGKELSNLAADKLENVINNIMKLVDTPQFKNASVGGKIKILWDEIIAKPFSEWWDTKGEKYISDKMASLGKGLGTTLSKGLLTILGVKDTGIVDDAVNIGSSFAEGFLEGFEGEKVADALADAIKRAFESLTNGSKLSKIILTGLAIKTLPSMLSGLSSLLNIFGSAKGAAINGAANLASFIGTPGNAMVQGTGLLSKLASFGYTLKGGAATASAMSGGVAAGLGGAAALGIAGTVAGLGSATKDLVQATKDTYESDKKKNIGRGATKLAMVGAGAAAGAAIGSVIPVVGTGIGALVGAGIGGLTAILSGNKVADSMTKITKSGEELKNENLDKHFGDITLSARDLQSRMTTIIGNDTIKKVQSYENAVAALDGTIQSIATKKSTIDFISFQTANGVKMTDKMKSEYISAAESIAEDVQSYISNRNFATNSAVDLLFGGNKAGESLKSGFNKYYGTYTKDINELGQKLNDTLADAISDGKLTIDEQKKIDELVNSLTKIQTEVEKKMAQQEFEAKIEGLKFDYGLGNGKMSASSFKALNEGLNEQMGAVITANKGARDRLLQELKAKYANTPGGINSEAGRKEANAVKQQYLYESASLVLTITDVSLQGLGDSYGKEIDNARAKLAKSFSFKPNAKKSAPDLFEDMATKLKKNATSFIEETYGMSESSQKAIAELVDTMQPQKEQLEQIKQGYEQLGLEVPSTISDALGKINYYEALSGNVSAMYTEWAEQIRDSKHKDQILQAIEEGTIDIPDKLAKAIQDACAEKVVKPTVEVEPTARTITGPAITSTDNAIQNAYANPFSTTGMVNLGLTPVTPFSTTVSTFRNGLLGSIQTNFANPLSVVQRVNVSVSKTATGGIVEGSTGIPYSSSYLAKNGYTRDKSGKVVKKANGGFIYDRILSWIGEDGPEVVIPLGANRRNRGIDLWKKAGQMMGIGNNAEGGAYGNASAIGRLLESGGDNSNSTETPSASTQNGNSKVTIEVGGITIQVNGDGGGNLSQMIQEQAEEIKDTLCSILADAVDDGFKNVPLATS